LPASLTNAMSISHMFQQRTSYSQGFIWRSIRTELQRIIGEVDHLLYPLPQVANCVTVYLHESS
jgi:hypothetical protein